MEEAVSAPLLLPVIEGFGNEVLFALPLLLAFIIGSLYLFVYRQAALTLADPANIAQNLSPDQLREQFLAGKDSFSSDDITITDRFYFLIAAECVSPLRPFYLTLSN